MAINYELDATSMYTRTPVYDLGGIAVPGLRVPVLFPDDTDTLWVCDSAHAGRWDLIAEEKLGDARLWWILAELNLVLDPQETPSALSQIRIPTRDRVKALL